MSFFLTGDFHGAQAGEEHYLTNTFIHKRAEESNIDYTSLKYCVMLGDTGFLWKGSSALSKTGYWVKWFNEKPYTLLCIPGNHDNYEDIYREENICPTDDKVYKDLGCQPLYKISDKIYFLKRGNTYNICGKKVLALGGAASIDKQSRKEHISWFEEELWSASEIHEFMEKLPLKVDMVLAHTCPTSVIKLMNGSFDFKDSVAEFNEAIKDLIDTPIWYFGHFHFTKKYSLGNRDYQVLYKDVVFVSI